MAKIYRVKINGVDPDKTPRSAASDLGLPCLLMPFCTYTQVNTVIKSERFHLLCKINGGTVYI